MHKYQVLTGSPPPSTGHTLSHAEKFSLALGKKVESEKPRLARGGIWEEKVKLLTGNFQSEMNYFEVSCHRGGGMAWQLPQCQA